MQKTNEYERGVVDELHADNYHVVRVKKGNGYDFKVTQDNGFGDVRNILNGHSEARVEVKTKFGKNHVKLHRVETCVFIEYENSVVIIWDVKNKKISKIVRKKDINWDKSYKQESINLYFKEEKVENGNPVSEFW